LALAQAQPAVKPQFEVATVKRSPDTGSDTININLAPFATGA